jgi:hypothetical protein
VISSCLEVLLGRRPISREDRKCIGGIGILQVISLLTDQGRVEIAASPDSLSKLVTRVAWQCPISLVVGYVTSVAQGKALNFAFINSKS